MKKPTRVKVKAPVRIDFAGGPSDVPPFSTHEWGYVVNSTIDMYAVVEIRTRLGSGITISSQDLNLSMSYASVAMLDHNSQLRLITKAVEMLGGEQGMDIIVATDVPPGSGLGASSSISVALLNALHLLRGESDISEEELALEAMDLQMNKLSIVVGGQDEFAASYGGFQSFKFENGKIHRKPLLITTEVAQKLGDHLLLCYSRTSHQSGDVLTRVMKRYSDGDPITTKQLRRLRSIAIEIESNLESGDASSAVQLLSTVWSVQRDLDPGVSTPALEAIFQIAKSHGGIGGKVAGAGGGGCVLLTCDPYRREEITQALYKEGFPTIPMQFTTNGVTAALVD